MLRLTALASLLTLLLPTVAGGQMPYEPPTLRTPPLKPADLKVDPAEHALRDLMPGWVPCRPLTEDEMAWIDSPHQMQSGGYYQPGNARGTPVIPHAWIADWPEPGPLLATGVPRGWWWMPADPELFGRWIVLAQGGRRGNQFYSLITAPLSAADLGRIPLVPPIRLLYAALRDREAKKRGVDPAALDRDSELLARGGYAPPPSVLAQAIERAKALDAQDELEEAATLLEMTLDDGGGDTRERLVAVGLMATSQLMSGQLAAALETQREARRLAMLLGWKDTVAALDETVVEWKALIEHASKADRLLIRGVASLERGKPSNAIGHLRRAEAALGPDEPETEADIRRHLATALHRTGDLAAARAEATRALALAERHEQPEIAAEMKALLARLGPGDPAPRPAR